MTLVPFAVRCIGGAVLAGALALGAFGQLFADETRRGHVWQRDIEIVIDGSRFMTTPSERDENEARVEEQGEDASGPSVCHRADGTTIWSTRAQECPDPQPPERSRVWSTSPD
ncbi:hypothetical protein SAMN02745148_00412 [Modicisalibacter ilicicola DSM 19980]|uniref:Uncharacterized protein n=1 Tax=Modicisalibacter ilicicola DSM 19980 TaxID=1121942 RepID=A0A1M4TCZ3_9GAMM|nr:hypothetical protein [Halomonas ilicicola]SHE42320.1 hypothetical protein SAMN02745148_00412 [Halomonas ilicicola DSM 19980]